MRIKFDDLWLCPDCLMMACNGEPTEDAALNTKIEAGLERLGPHLVPDFDSETGKGIEEFMKHTCDCCKDARAGSRHRFAVLEEGEDDTRPELDDFVTKYLETALWSSTDDEGEPLDKNYSIQDLDRTVLVTAIRDCDKFREQARGMLDELDDDTRAAHDFWLTRNGHGAGFWDGDWPINGERLTAISKTFGEVNLYIGDDGMIYLMGG